MKETFVLTVEKLEKSFEDLRNLDNDTAAKKRLKWDRQAAKRAAKAIGLVEQAKSAVTELDAINALANYEANHIKPNYTAQDLLKIYDTHKHFVSTYYSKSYSIMHEWHHAFNHCLNFESIFGIWEKDFLDEEPFTVGDYLSVVETLTPETFADKARRIGDFWQFAFTMSQNRKQYAENCAEKNVL